MRLCWSHVVRIGLGNSILYRCSLSQRPSSPPPPPPPRRRRRRRSTSRGTQHGHLSHPIPSITTPTTPPPKGRGTDKRQGSDWTGSLSRQAVTYRYPSYIHPRWSLRVQVDIRRSITRVTPTSSPLRIIIIVGPTNKELTLLSGNFSPTSPSTHLFYRPSESLYPSHTPPSSPA